METTVSVDGAAQASSSQRPGPSVGRGADAAVGGPRPLVLRVSVLPHM